MPFSENRFRFTQRKLADLTPADKPQMFYDEGCPGLGVRLSPKGKLAFFYQRGVTRVTLPAKTLVAARHAVTSRRAAVEEAGEAQEWTLGYLFTNWMELKAKPHKRTWQRDEARFRRHMKHWERKKIRKISRLDVMNLHNQICQSSGPYAANDTLAFIASLFNYAEQFGFVGRNPAKGIKRFPEQERERYLLPEEFPRWYKAVHELTVPVSRDFFLLALWTGVRRECVMAMRWEQLDLEAGVWRIPKEIDKGKRDLLIYLSDEALQILRDRRPVVESEWVLPSPRQSSSGHYADPKAAWQRVLELSGLKDLRIHDLRRTLGSWMAEGGASLQIIGKALGHKSTSATRIYARVGGTVVRDATNAAAKAMRSTLDSE